MTDEQTQARQFADRLLADTEELASYLDGISVAQWNTPTPEEEWPVIVTVEHTALGYEASWGWIQTLLRTGAWPEITQEDIDAANAAKAAEQVDRDPAEALARLRGGGEAIATRVAALSPAEFERSAPFLLMGGRNASVALLVGRVIPGHFAHHATSIRAACDATKTNEATA